VRWRKKSAFDEREDSRVVKEARAVLDGTARNTTYLLSQRLPTWVYVNQLAHADRATLVGLVKGVSVFHPATLDYACAQLAAELLALASGGRALADVQRALVPLELDLLGDAYSPGLSPATLMTLASRALAVAGFDRPNI
jgi:hypothetical protein